MSAEKDNAKRSRFAIPWTYSPAASELGTPLLKHPRHDGEIHLME